MNERGQRARSAWRLVGLLLGIGVALHAHATPPSKLPGRKPDSQEPWGAFLGRAAHLAIGGQYRLQHPKHTVFLDSVDLSTIVEEGELGDPKRLSTFVRRLRPDITDVRALVLFEIKPDNEQGREQGREQAGYYLAVLNAVVAPDKQLSGGTGFDGSIFLEFENGGALWELSWRTPEPGVTLYRWNSRPKKSNASWQQRAAQPEEELTRKEVEQRGEWAEQVLRAVYEGGEWPKEFQGQVYRPVDCH